MIGGNFVEMEKGGVRPNVGSSNALAVTARDEVGDNGATTHD